METLITKRLKIADRFFENNDLLGYKVEDCDGWEYSTAYNDFTRNIYVLPENLDNNEPTILKKLTISFYKDSSVIEWASISGHPIPLRGKV